MSLYKEAWFITLIVSIILFIIAVLGYLLSTNQDDVSFWIWLLVIFSFILVIISFILYGVQGNKKVCGETIIIKHEQCTRAAQPIQQIYPTESTQCVESNNPTTHSIKLESLYPPGYPT